MRVIFFYLILLYISSCTSPQKNNEAVNETKSPPSLSKALIPPTRSEIKDCLTRRENFYKISNYSSHFRKILNELPEDKRISWAVCEFNNVNLTFPTYDKQGASNLLYNSMHFFPISNKKFNSLAPEYSFFDFKQNKILLLKIDNKLPNLIKLFSQNEIDFFKKNFIGFRHKLEADIDTLFPLLFLNHLQIYLFYLNEFKYESLNCEDSNPSFLTNRLLESAIIVKLYLIRLKKFYPKEHLKLTKQQGFNSYIEDMLNEATSLFPYLISNYACTIKNEEFNILYKEFLNLDNFRL